MSCVVSGGPRDAPERRSGRASGRSKLRRALEHVQHGMPESDTEELTLRDSMDDVSLAGASWHHATFCRLCFSAVGRAEVRLSSDKARTRMSLSFV